MVHGALKPLNIIVLRDGVVKIVISAPADRRGGVTLHVPEQVRRRPGRPEIAPHPARRRVDEMLTRRAPFEGDSPDKSGS